PFRIRCKSLAPYSSSDAASAGALRPSSAAASAGGLRRPSVAVATPSPRLRPHVPPCPYPSRVLCSCTCPPPFFAGLHCGKGQTAAPRSRARCRRGFFLPRREDPQVRTPLRIGLRKQNATTMEPTIASHSTSGAVSGISRPDDLCVGTGSCIYSYCEEKLRQLCAARRKLLKKVGECSISITERSGACRPRFGPIARARRA